MLLVVDDEIEIRRVLAEFLTLAGFAVLQAGSGEDALQVLADQPGLRLIVTDVRMAGISGLELADRAVALRPDLKIVVVSGYFPPQAIRYRFLKKPFRLSGLVDAVEAELAAPLPS